MAQRVPACEGRHVQPVIDPIDLRLRKKAPDRFGAGITHPDVRVGSAQFSPGGPSAMNHRQSGIRARQQHSRRPFVEQEKSDDDGAPDLMATRPSDIHPGCTVIPKQDRVPRNIPKRTLERRKIRVVIAALTIPDAFVGGSLK